MVLTLIIALQTAAPALAPAQPQGPRWAIPVIASPAADFSLARLRAAMDGRCLGAGAGDVLVCGRRGGTGAYPMAEWARIFAPRPIRAEMDLGGNVQGRAYAEQKDFSGQDRGAVSNRVMIGIGTRF